MDRVLDLGRFMHESERRDQSQIFVRLRGDSGKRRQFAAIAFQLRKPGDFRRGRIWVRRRGQMRGEKQFGDAHRLIDQHLFFVPLVRPPFQHSLKSNDRWLEFEQRLKKERELER